MMNNIKWMFIKIALIAIIVIWNGCTSHADNAVSDPVVPVKAEKVIKKRISFPIISSGILSSSSEIRLAFKTGGIVEKVFVDEGQSVVKGQILAKLNLAEIKAQFNRARDAFEKAERDFERIKNLYADSVVTLEEFQDTRTALSLAKAQFEIAEFNLKNSVIKAPAVGKILKQLVEPNEMVSPGIPVLIFGSHSDNWIIQTGVSDFDVIKLNLNDSAFVYFDAYPGIRFPARVTQIAAASNPMTGTYEIELFVDALKFNLFSGFVGKIEIKPKTDQEYYLIPVESLVEADGKNGYLFYLPRQENKVEKIKIIIDHIMESYVATLSDLGKINQIITEGAAYLTDGSPVKVVN